jgi:hypothetical protein
MARKKSVVTKLQSVVASEEELKAFWTAVLRGVDVDGNGPPSLANRIRVSELLAKAHGSFVKRLELQDVAANAMEALSDAELESRLKSIGEGLH